MAPRLPRTFLTNAAERGVGAASLAMLFYRAPMRSTTFSPFGRGFALMVLPLRFALIEIFKSLWLEVALSG
jgi:hypothetical protein